MKKPGARRLRQFPKEEEESVPKTIRLPRELWERIDRIAKAERKSRNFVVFWFLKWSADDYEAENKSGRR